MSTPKPISNPFVGSNCAVPPAKTVTVAPATATTSPFSIQWISVPMGTWDIVGAGGGGGSTPEKKTNKDGCTCKKCKEHYQYAEPNQDDGTLICYGCRMNW
jgi:hypothetical protein